MNDEEIDKEYYEGQPNIDIESLKDFTKEKQQLKIENDHQDCVIELYFKELVLHKIPPPQSGIHHVDETVVDKDNNVTEIEIITESS